MSEWRFVCFSFLLVFFFFFIVHVCWVICLRFWFCLSILYLIYLLLHTRVLSPLYNVNYIIFFLIKWMSQSTLKRNQIQPFNSINWSLTSKFVHKLTMQIKRPYDQWSHDSQPLLTIELTQHKNNIKSFIISNLTNDPNTSPCLIDLYFFHD